MIGVIRGLREIEVFETSMKKMSLNSSLNESELEFSLGVVVLLLNEYSGNKSKSYLFDLAYYIVLKVASNNGLSEPLLDVCSNFGFYPVSKYILNKAGVKSISSFSLSYQLEKFHRDGIFETYEQRSYREDLVNSDHKDNCFVAPTSFGKSSLIKDIVASYGACKVAVIVPTKSLLVQTVNFVKKNFSKRTVIFHDEMYNDEGDFIAVLTQERALRLLKVRNVSFDLMIIDEAHKLFEMDGRSVLLTRLIRRNRRRNRDSVNYYLSPLISNSGNLKVDGEQNFFERKIISNIKSPDYYEYRLDGKVYKYNRFLDDFYFYGESEGCYKYILDNAKNKNFLYLRSPYKVELLASEIGRFLIDLGSEELDILSEVISDNVHNDFYCVDYIKKGLVYLHGKLPDLIKEYLEYKFSLVSEIKYIVANSVILEGVNLPVDNMFIMNTYSLDDKGLINLIGRVNRLNEVFDGEGDAIKKLMPSVHFVNTEEYNKKSSNMAKKMSLLKVKSYKDTVKNPLLYNFDFDNLKIEIERAAEKNDPESLHLAEVKYNRTEGLINREKFLIDFEDDPESEVVRLLMESGLAQIYYDPEHIYSLLETRIGTIAFNANWVVASVIDKIYLFFIDGLEDQVADSVFLRLRNKAARNYYSMFSENLHRLSLKEHISETLRYFLSIKDTMAGRDFYIGSSYGEISKVLDDGGYSRKNYVDLSSKNNKELVNLALVKIKIESDFVSYTLNNYVGLLFDLDLVTEKEHDLYIYGTEKKANSDFVRLGMSGSLINKLNGDGQLENLSIDQFGSVEFNEEFRSYINSQDDLVQFEVRKFVDV